MDENRVVRVRNRFEGLTGYNLPDERIQRSFSAGEIKEIPFKELKQLSYQPGGELLLREYLVIENDDEVIKELIGAVEPEYSYTDEDVKNIMLNGTLPEFLDMLDYAPQGILENVKNLAVKTRLNDVRKREAIYDKLGYDVTKAIELLDLEKEELKKQGQAEESTSTGRRVPVASKETKNENTSGRRAAAPAQKYKNVTLQ